jgi:hypothetical protein
MESTVTCVPERGLGRSGLNGFFSQSRVAFTSWEVKPLPSCHFAFLFSAKTIEVSSGCSHLSARSATMSCWASSGFSARNCTSWLKQGASGQIVV